MIRLIPMTATIIWWLLATSGAFGAPHPPDAGRDHYYPRCIEDPNDDSSQICDGCLNGYELSSDETGRQVCVREDEQ